MYHFYKKALVSTLLLGLTLAHAAESLSNPESRIPSGRLFEAKSDFITECGMDSRDLSQDPNDAPLMNQAIQLLETDPTPVEVARDCRKICEIDLTPGNPCDGTHGVCLKCRYECS